MLAYLTSFILEALGGGRRGGGEASTTSRHSLLFSTSATGSASADLPVSSRARREQAAAGQRPFPNGGGGRGLSVGGGEMAQELAIRGVRVEEYSAPARKGVLVRRGAFAVRREVFAVGKMSVQARRLLRKRLGSELDAVRDALRKAEVLSCGAGATGAAAPAGKDDGRLMAAEAPVGEDGGRAAKRRKVAPSTEQGAGKPKRMRQDDSRERLAGRLASLAAVLPDHVVAFLLNQRVGDADSRGDGGEIKKDVQYMKGGALFQLKMLLNKFAPESTPRNRRAPMVATGGSCLSRHQGAGGKTATVQEEEEEEVVVVMGVDICGGVSRIAIRDIAEEYGELVEDIGVKLLSPLQRKYVDLAEQGEYVDICGDASPVVFPTNTKAGDISSSPSLSSSDSDASSSDSDSSSSSNSDSKSDPGQSVNSRSPLPSIVPKEKDTYAQPPGPAPEAVHTAERPDDVQDKCAPPVPTVLQITRSPPAPPVRLPKVNDTYAQPPEPAPKTVQITQQEEIQDQCAPPAPTGHPVTSSTPGPAAVPKENDTYKQQPPEPPEAVQIAEPEQLQDQRVAPVATGHPITGSAPPPAVLPEENGTSSQPPELAPVAAQIAEPEEVQGEGAAPAPAPTNDLSDLVTMAKEEAERRRQLAKERAKAKARRMLLEMEKAARPDERVHPRDMELLGIAAFEHVASTVQDARTAPPRVNDGGDLRVSPGGPSVLQQLGVFLKAGDGSEDEEEEQRQQPPPAVFASHGEDMEVEDGEIR
ncbi:hypothetical protein C2845_PM11G09510 [Panicum miliaceum]|uniref:Uncharacterized protein n=1 Tax=Panicum miliaceum TaxID=4540 RepID=A0A3L6RV90_PANMI|nr:hypothetical protein C2845_PM11G09510 [Panicum miliaceum]